MVALPLLLSDAGLRVHVAAAIVAGSAQAKLTASLKPAPKPAVRVEVPDWPGALMLKLVGFAENVKPGTTVTVVRAESALP